MTHILIADDDRHIRELIKLTLRLRRIETTLVRDGFKAVDMAHEQQFDLILLDMRMPQMNGMETARLIRSGIRNAHTPILFLSGDGRILDYQLENCYVMLKPFSIDSLITQVDYILGATLESVT